MQIINALVKTQHKAPYAIADLISQILPTTLLLNNLQYLTTAEYAKHPICIQLRDQV